MVNVSRFVSKKLVKVHFPQESQPFLSFTVNMVDIRYVS